MVDKKKIIKLTNRDTGFAGYTIPDLNIHRSFSPGETKEITFDEIERLSWVPGGKEILRDYFIIEDEEAAKEILGEVEPEYYYTKETVDKLLKDGSIAQLQDALDFGPTGVKELIKQEAVVNNLDSSAKREVIQKATNFNVTKSIELNEDSNDDSQEGSSAPESRRRAAPIETAGNGSRYKIVK